jgi:hypothetical protein
LASEISPGKKIVTRFLVLTKTKEPVVEEHVRDVEPGNVKRTLAGVERVWRAIESGVFYPAPSTMNCASCGYRAACHKLRRAVTALDKRKWRQAGRCRGGRVCEQRARHGRLL